jgi:hypothetical protein
MKNTPLNLINIAIDFIESNHLGQTDFFGSNEEEKNYTDIEKNRLDYLLNICSDLVNEKISKDDLQSIIEDKLKINENYSNELSEIIKNKISEKTEEIILEKEESTPLNQENKKTIFSAMVEKK